MPRGKKVETTALYALVVHIVFLGIAFVLHSKGTRAQDVNPALLAQLWFLAPGTLVWLMVLVHGRQKRMAQREREEMERLRASRVSEEIFEEQELDRMRAATALRIFERFLVPAFSILLSAVLMFLCYSNLANAWRVRAMVSISNPSMVAAGMAVIVFVGFVLAYYTVGLSREPGLGLLRAGGSYLMGNVAGSLVVVLAMILAHFHVVWLAWLGAVAAYGIPALMGLIGVEIILNLILDIYRPRVPGRERRWGYDSRLLGSLSAPGNVLKTVATTLDYQFGFQVSDTWFYRFMARAIVPLIVAQVLLLWLLSGVVVVHDGEIAFIERFGKPRLRASDRARNLRASVFGPGYHLKAPWPIEKLNRVPKDAVYEMQIGRRLYDEHDAPKTLEEMERAMWGSMGISPDDEALLWGEIHIPPGVGKELDFLVPSVPVTAGGDRREGPPLDIAHVKAHISFRLKRNADGNLDEDAAYDFAYTNTEPVRMMENLGYRALCRVAASHPLMRWANVDRAKATDKFRRLLQTAADDSRLGVEVVYVAMPGVYPPARGARPYEELIKDRIHQRTLRYKAELAAVKSESEAEAEAAEMIGEAEAYGYRLKVMSGAQAERFKVKASAFRAAPDVYWHRQYFSALEDVLEGHRLFIVPITEDEELTIDLQEKLGVDILDIPIEEGIK